MIKGLSIYITISLLSILLFTSCTPQQRAARKIEKALRLDPNIAQSYTAVRHDTIVTKLVTKDTVFNFFQTKDTVTIVKDNLTMRYFYNTKDSTVYLSGKCDTITIYRDVPISVTNIKAESKKWYQYFDKYILLLLIVLVLVLLIQNRK